ncbi:MAG: hypothetical protein F9K43_20530, partial [Bauldia sp.]
MAGGHPVELVERQPALAFAEMVRLLFELLQYQVPIDGDLVGPNGADGFRNIRYIFANDISTLDFMLIVYGLLAATLAGFMAIERSPLGVAFRMIGEDATLASLQGLAVTRLRVLAAGMSGALAGLGGCGIWPWSSSRPALPELPAVSAPANARVAWSVSLPG